MISKFKIICGSIPLAACIITTAACLLSGRDLSAESIISFIKTDNYILAALILICMFALKSLSVCFPIALLYVAGGMIFPPIGAIIINIAGTAVCLMLPYLIGRFSGSDLVERTLIKYPRLSRIVANQKNNEFFVSFMMRAVRVFPTDAVSLYLGSVRFSVTPYLVAGLLGELPVLICETLMGVSINEPSSPLFIISAVLTALTTLISVVWYLIHAKKTKGNTVKDNIP